MGCFPEQINYSVCAKAGRSSSGYVSKHFLSMSTLWVVQPETSAGVRTECDNGAGPQLLLSAWSRAEYFFVQLHSSPSASANVSCAAW